MRLQWRPPRCNGTPITSYQLERARGDSHSALSTSTSTGDLSISATALEGSTRSLVALGEEEAAGTSGLAGTTVAPSELDEQASIVSSTDGQVRGGWSQAAGRRSRGSSRRRQQGRGAGFESVYSGADTCFEVTGTPVGR